LGKRVRRRRGAGNKVTGPWEKGLQGKRKKKLPYAIGGSGNVPRGENVRQKIDGKDLGKIVS